MHPLIQNNLAKIADLCRSCGVKRLELFGSAARGDFNSESSDVDFLVEFTSDSWHHAADNWFDLLEGLEAMLGRKVDLVSTPDIKNPYFLEVANRYRTELYAA